MNSQIRNQKIEIQKTSNLKNCGSSKEPPFELLSFFSLRAFFVIQISSFELVKHRLLRRWRRNNHRSMPLRLFHFPNHIFADAGVAEVILIGGAEVINGAAAFDTVDDFAVAHAAV